MLDCCFLGGCLYIWGEVVVLVFICSRFISYISIIFNYSYSGEKTYISLYFNMENISPALLPLMYKSFHKQQPKT